MKDIHKSEYFYYILVPAVILIWPLWLIFGGLPAAKTNYHKESQQYLDAEIIIDEILTLAPDRLDYAKAKKAGSDFDYAVAVDQVGRLCRISSSNYRLSTGPVVKSRGGQKSQDGRITLEKVGIEDFAKFLSIMQFRWPNLQCSMAKLTKEKDAKDTWKANITFKYFQ